MVTRQAKTPSLWVARHPGREQFQRLVRLVRREYGGPDVFLSEKHLEAFAVILPAHLHPKDEAFKAYWEALGDLSRDGVDLDGVWDVLLTAGYAAHLTGSRQRERTRRQAQTAVRARTRSALLKARDLARRCHADATEHLDDESRALGDDLRALGGEDVTSALARLEDGIDAFARWLDEKERPVVLGDVTFDAWLRTIDADYFGRRGFTLPMPSGRRGGPSKPWVERDAPAQLRRAGVPGPLVDALLYPLRTPRRPR